jgi:hypothetical protein
MFFFSHNGCDDQPAHIQTLILNAPDDDGVVWRHPLSCISPVF